MKSWIIVCLSLLPLIVQETAGEGISVCPSREIQATEGEVTSPNFPSPYPSNSDCTLVINGGENVKIKLKFNFIDIEGDEEDDGSYSCYDDLMIVDGSKTSEYCGSGRIPADYTSTGNKISITFRSDGSVESKGFKISFSTFSVNVQPAGRWVCTSGSGYIVVDNFSQKNNGLQDDIHFGFRSSQSSGMIMYAKSGQHKDYIHVSYKGNKVFMYHIELGGGTLKAQTTNLRLNDNKWHNVRVIRLGRTVNITIDNGLASFVGQTPGDYTQLNLPESKAYILGAPSSQNLEPNFNGCIRDFEVDGHEPMTNAWAKKPDYKIEGEGIRLCTASDEQ